MKVIVDNKIPFIKEAIEKIADEVVYAPGKDFTPILGKRCGCAHYPYTHPMQPGITGRQPSEVYRYGNNRIRPY